MAPVVPATWPGDPSTMRDEPDPRRLVSSERLATGRVWDVRRDTVDLGDGQTVVRELLQHPGAVGVIALDDEDRVLLIRQYRHPVAMLLWEPVAGLLDVPGEPPVRCAQRELVEEAGLQAGDWQVLLDFETTPGGSSEVVRVFLARDLSPAPGGRPPGDGEERDLPTAWVPLDLAVDHVLAGRLTAMITVAGLVAARAARDLGWRTLRPADARWPAHDVVTAEGRAYGG
jgi:ADP-ribose pyrophosphatase